MASCLLTPDPDPDIIMFVSALPLNPELILKSENTSPSKINDKFSDK
jgi:hypothetical protein